MRRFFFIPVLLILPVLLLYSCSGSSKKAVAYNDTIVRYQVMVVEKMNLLDKSFEKGDLKQTEKNRNSAIKQVDESAKTIAALGDYEGNNTFKNAALKLMDVYKMLLEKHYSEIIILGDTHLRKLSMYQQKKLDKLRSDIRLELDLALDEFRNKQNEFAGKYGFRLNNVQKDS